MPTYHVRVLNPAIALDRTLAIPDDEYILDIAELTGIRLPSGCKQGNCSACVAKLVEGEIDQSEQVFLSAAEMAQGYVLLCVGTPQSDCTLLTHQEAVLYNQSLYFKGNPPTESFGSSDGC